ncbi:MAG: hypothetical protein WC560_10505 [Syntrophales bacterium]
MVSRRLALVMGIIFLLTHSGGCAGLQKDPNKSNDPYSYQTDVTQEESMTKAEHIGTDQYSQWEKEMKKDKREWFTAALLVLCISLLIGATVSASFQGNGFFFGISN